MYGAMFHKGITWTAELIHIFSHTFIYGDSWSVKSNTHDARRIARIHQAEKCTAAYESKPSSEEMWLTLEADCATRFLS